VAIGDARFIEQTQQARDEATQLYEITEQLASSLDMDSVLDLITAKATEMLGSGGSSIHRYDQASDSLLHAKAYNVSAIMLEKYFGTPGVGVTGIAFRERRPVWSSDISDDPRINRSDGAPSRALEEAGLKAVLSVPIVVRDEPYGILNVFYHETHDFTDAEVRLLSTLADSAAVAIGNARFIEETQQARDVATQLYEIVEQLASSPDMDTVLELITRKATELLGVKPQLSGATTRPRRAWLLPEDTICHRSGPRASSSDPERGRRARPSRNAGLSLGVQTPSPTPVGHSRTGRRKQPTRQRASGALWPFQ